MNFEQLTTLLNHPKPQARMVAIHTIKLVDEVRALDAISKRVPMEMDKSVEKSLKAVGRDLLKLRNDGFDTITAICEHFNVYSEVLSYADENDFKEINRMVASKTDNRKDDDFNDKVVNTASVMIASRVLGASASLGAMVKPMGASSNLESTQEKLKKMKRRVRPTIPTNTDVSRWVKLLQSSSEDDRVQALVQMNSSNNPNSLQYMAHAYYADKSERVRETAKRLGRQMYWNVVYHKMEKSGEVKRIMEDFASELGVTLKKDLHQDPRVATGVHQSIDDILKNAQQARKKRGLKR
ncbi:MAG: hypothetical protein AAFV93_01285 [Chloroflexota bacterium]